MRGEIGLRLRELIRQTCEAQEVYIVKGHISADHVHLLLSVPPNIAVSDLVQRLKGEAAGRCWKNLVNCGGNSGGSIYGRAGIL